MPATPIFASLDTDPLSLWVAPQVSEDYSRKLPRYRSTSLRHRWSFAHLCCTFPTGLAPQNSARRTGPVRRCKAQNFSDLRHMECHNLEGPNRSFWHTVQPGRFARILPWHFPSRASAASAKANRCVRWCVRRASPRKTLSIRFSFVPARTYARKCAPCPESSISRWTKQ